MDITYSQELAHYFDRLRFEQNMTQETLVEGIISLRQFRRYLNGTSYLPQEVINLFSERLGYRTAILMLEFEAEKIKEARTIIDFYNSVANRDHVSAQHFMNHYPIEKVKDMGTKMLYQNAVDHLELQTGKITEEAYIKRTVELMDYPEIMKRKVLTTFEITILSSLVNVSGFADHQVIADRLLLMADNPTLIYSGQNEKMLTYVLQRLGQYYGIHKEYRKVLETCDKAIKYNLEWKLFYLLDFIYYFKALAHDYLGEHDEYEKALFQCYCTLQIEGSPLRYERFRKLVESDWPINFHEFAKQYIEKNKF